jgi:hypothetical protein
MIGNIIKVVENSIGSPGFVVFRVFWVLSWIPWIDGSPVLGLLLWLITGTVIGSLAKRKGRNPILWGVFAGLFWGVGLVLLSLLSSRKPVNLQCNNDDEYQKEEQSKER